MKDIRILAIPGSLRRGSRNAALVRAAADLAAATPGVAVECWGGLAAVPPFDEDVEHDTPAAVADLRAAIAAADAVLVVTPEYNGSVPGQLKNALDWASRPYGDSVLTGAAVGIASASPSETGGADAARDLARIVDRAGGTVVGDPVAVPASHDAFDDGGRLVDPELERALTALLRTLSGSATASAA